MYGALVSLHALSSASSSATHSVLTPEMLDEKLQFLLHQLTRNISLAVGKISQELRGEIAYIGEQTDSLNLATWFNMCMF